MYFSLYASTKLFRKQAVLIITCRETNHRIIIPYRILYFILRKSPQNFDIPKLRDTNALVSPLRMPPPRPMPTMEACSSGTLSKKASPSIQMCIRDSHVRVNTISQSPTMTTAGSGVKGIDKLFDFANRMSPLGNASADECADYLSLIHI